MMEYFIDQEKYFYLILLHTYAIICVGGTAMLAIGAVILTCVQYVCGMFRIASYRIEHAININSRQNITLKNEILMSEGIIYAVEIHRQAMKLSNLLVSIFEIMAFCLIVFGVACLSLNLFQSASSEKTVSEFCLPLLYVVTMILCLFIGNYGAQNITDHSNYVFSTAYNVQWYRAPLNIQRMILFLLQRKAKEFTLNIGGLFTGSMECFATVI
ncbi:PREDICTED: odorant receptor 43a-like [Atta colombica]|uniref:odorant receptor 43a-like n=1 Tax=Atta colombica TaxID=520822 RepID=UPI00084C841D|nr:PREDICTED: odorant receptor 43a-like [Atta colombica]